VTRLALALAALLCASCVDVHVRQADAGPDEDTTPDVDAPDDAAQPPDLSDEVAVDAPAVDAVEAGQGGAPGLGGGSGSGGTGAGGGGLGGSGSGGSGGAAPTPSAIGQVLIVEIMFDSAAALPPVGGTSDDVGEWVELENQTDTEFDLYGCSLLDMSHVDPITAHVILPPRGLVTLSRSAPGFLADYVYSTVKFSDGGDIARFTCGALVVDVVDFRAGFTLMQSYSLSRDSSGAWCAPTHIYNVTTKGVDHGTPGALNDPCGGDR
jgi:hypothetical protein